LQTGVRVACDPNFQCYCESLLKWNSCSESGTPFSQFTGRLNLSVVQNLLVPLEGFFCIVHCILGTSNLLQTGTTVHRILSVQLLLPPASFSSLSSSEQHVMYNYEGRASCLCRHLSTRNSEHWWITAHSPFARMCAVYSEAIPQGEQNPTLLCYSVTLRQNIQFCMPSKSCVCGRSLVGIAGLNPGCLSS